MSYAAGDVINFAYTGAKQSVTLPPGRYKLECWGAQGGYRSNASYGGKGGYAQGELSLDIETILYVYAGGSGNMGGTSGGFNGGGSRSTYPGGGGAYPDSSGDDDRGGGGGSGFVWAGSNAPSGYLLGPEHQLTNASTTAGNASFAGPTGSAETGHSGNGYVRITVLEIYTYPPETPGNFRQTGKDYYSISLAWDASADADGYRLYKDGALLATLTATTYTDANMLPGESHAYQLVAYNADGDSSPAQLTASTQLAYYIIAPVIQSASFSVNPADINANTVLTVMAEDVFRILEPERFYSGDLYAGEV